MLSENHKRIGLVLLLTGIAFACSTTLYLPNESALISKGELKGLLDGRAVYIKKCGSCHSLYLPEKYQPGEWKIQMDKMAPKSNLTPKEKENILKYLTKNDGTLACKSFQKGSEKSESEGEIRKVH